MDKKVEEYLKNVALPEYESHPHRQELRQKLLDEMKRRHQMATKRNLRRIIYVVAVLVGLSALAFASAKYIRKLHFWKEVGEEGGTYIFRNEVEEVPLEALDPPAGKIIGSSTSRLVLVGIDSKSREQAEKDLMEIEQLKAEGKRELLGVKETKTGTGEIIKTHIYKYVLSDGREIKGNDAPEPRAGEAFIEWLTCPFGHRYIGFKDMGVAIPDDEQVQKRYKQKQENIRRAKEEGSREITRVLEIETDGKALAIYYVTYRTPDGDTIQSTEGPIGEEEYLRATVDQQQCKYLTRKFMESDPDEILPEEEREIEGRKFIFTRNLIRLQDGREVIYSDGEPSENN